VTVAEPRAGAGSTRAGASLIGEPDGIVDDRRITRPAICSLRVADGVDFNRSRQNPNRDALNELNELAAGAGPRSRGSRSPGHRPSSGASAQWPQRGNQAQSTSDSALTINTAVVAGNQLIRLYGSLPADASDDTVAAVIAIETSIAFSTLRPSLKQVPAPRVSLAPVMHSASAADDTDDDDENDLTPPVSEGSPSASQSVDAREWRRGFCRERRRASPRSRCRPMGATSSSRSSSSGRIRTTEERRSHSGEASRTAPAAILREPGNAWRSGSFRALRDPHGTHLHDHRFLQRRFGQRHAGFYDGERVARPKPVRGWASRRPSACPDSLDDWHPVDRPAAWRDATETSKVVLRCRAVRTSARS
jgi:hypothetical protein